MSASPAAAPQRVLAGFLASLLATAVARAAAGHRPRGLGAAEPLAGHAGHRHRRRAAHGADQRRRLGAGRRRQHRLRRPASSPRARPAGAAAGTQETPRNNLLAYDIRTGELITSFAPSLNGQALAVDGLAGRLAHLRRRRLHPGRRRSPATASPPSTPPPARWSTHFAAERQQPGARARRHRQHRLPRRQLHRRRRRSAAPGWPPSRPPTARCCPGRPCPASARRTATATATATSDEVLALVVTGGGTQVVAAGRFATLNGVKATGVGALDAVTGATRPFAVNQLITNQGVNSAVYSLTHRRRDRLRHRLRLLAARATSRAPSPRRPTAARSCAINDCRGDTTRASRSTASLYVASARARLRATSAASRSRTRGCTSSPPRSRSRRPAPSAADDDRQQQLRRPARPARCCDWFPTMTPGTFTGQGQAGWSVTGNGQYVVYGGEFPRVNGVGQQGLVRFAVPALAPNKVGPAPRGLAADGDLAAAGHGAESPGRPPYDQDNEYLTYRSTATASRPRRSTRPTEASTLVEHCRR